MYFVMKGAEDYYKGRRKTSRVSARRRSMSVPCASLSTGRCRISCRCSITIRGGRCICRRSRGTAIPINATIAGRDRAISSATALCARALGRRQRDRGEEEPALLECGSVKLNEIHFHPIESTDTEERSFRSRQLHVTEQVPQSKISVYRRDNPQLLHIDPYLGAYFYRINTTRPQFRDKRVRQRWRWRSIGKPS